MAISKDIGTKGYCDKVFGELDGMKTRVLGLVKDIESMTGPDREHLDTHIPHLRDIANTIEWKLEILMKVCPAGFKSYFGETETPSVSAEASPAELEKVVGGYAGG